MRQILDFLDSLHWSPAEEIIIDGKLHRYKLHGDKEQNCSYKFDEYGGWVRNHKEGVTEKWSSKEPISPEKKREHRRRVAVYKREIDEEKKNAAAKAKEIYESSPSASSDHPYLIAKGIKPHNAKQDGADLIIPAYGDNGEIKTIQRIKPDGFKLFLEGGEAKEAYNLLYAEGDSIDTIIIAEGFATAATIREATGAAVAMAFSASNVPKITKLLHKLYPTSQLIVAADNDRFSSNGQGKPFNAGVEYANKVSKIAEIRPVQFPADIEGKPTDYNDLMRIDGLEEVKKQLLPALASSSNNNIYAPDPENDGVYVNDWEPKFRVLGFNNGTYYYYPDSTQQIVELTAPSHTINNLLRIAPHSFWKKNFRDARPEELADHLIQQAHEKGIFSPERQLRGRGIWMDKGQVLFNNGTAIYLNGSKKIPLNKWESKFIYERALEIEIPDEPCKSSEAQKLREICEMASWQNKMSGTLLAGWCVVAMACSALPWRPHIWITGEGGSGKTTVLKEIVAAVLGDLMLRIDGGTTEAAIRQVLGNDAAPIIYDEAESEGEKDKAVMEGVMMLARKASSGAALIKGGYDGTPNYYYCKSAFCFSCINPEVKRFADERRVVLLELKKSSDDISYQSFLTEIRTHLTPKFRRRLLGRVMANLPTLLKNCQVFTDAATNILNDRAAADQIGSILGGVYLLHSANEVDYKRACEFIKEHDLRQYTVVDEISDAYQLLSYICSRKIRISSTYELTIGQLVINSYTKTTLDIDHAIDVLRLHGIWPKEDGVWIASNSPSLRDLMKGAPWSTWRGIARIPGCVPHKGGARYAPGVAACRGWILPKSYFFPDGEEILNQEEED